MIGMVRCPLNYCDRELPSEDAKIIHLIEEHSVTPKFGKSMNEQVDMTITERIEWVKELVSPLMDKNHNRRLEGKELKITERDMERLATAEDELERTVKIINSGDEYGDR